MAENQLLSEAADQLKRAAGVIKKTARRWWIVAICSVVGIGLGVVAPHVIAPRYQSEAVLIYREGVQSAITSDRGSNLEQTGSRLRETLLSRARLQKVVEEFKLAKSENQLDVIQAVLELRKKTEFDIDAGGAIRISVMQPKPELAQKLAARLSTMLIEDNTRWQIEQAESSSSFILTQARDAEKGLEDKQQAQAAFLVKHPEFAQEQWRRTESRESKTGGTSRVSRLEAQLTRLRRIQRGEAVPAEPRESGSPQIDPAIVAEREAAMTDVTNSQRDVSEALAQFTEAHPDVQKAKRRLKAAETRLAKAKEAYATATIAAKEWKSLTPVAPAPVEAQNSPALQRQIDALQDELASARKAEASGKQSDSKSKIYDEVVELETEWARLNRELNAAREEKEQVDSYRFQTSIQSQSVATGAADTITLLDEAYLPREPIGPKKSLMVVIGFAVMMLIGTGAALVVALLDDRFYEGADVERANIVPLLVSIPKPNRWSRRG